MSSKEWYKCGSEKNQQLYLCSCWIFQTFSSFWLLVLREALVYISSLFLLARRDLLISAIMKIYIHMDNRVTSNEGIRSWSKFLSWESTPVRTASMSARNTPSSGSPSTGLEAALRRVSGVLACISQALSRLCEFLYLSCFLLQFSPFLHIFITCAFIGLVGCDTITTGKDSYGEKDLKGYVPKQTVYFWERGRDRKDKILFLCAFYTVWVHIILYLVKYILFYT